MGANEGSYSRDMFDERKQYVCIAQQQGVPVVDADVNDENDILRTLVQRCYQDTVGDGSPNNGFKFIEATPNVNDFAVQGGDGTVDGAGVLVRYGLRGIIPDLQLKHSGTDKRIFPEVTGVTSLVLTDSAANYVVNELAGRTLVPDVDNPGTTFTVLSNTATSITVTAGDLTTATSAKKFYRLNLSTPGGARTDVAWVHFFVDEWDAVEDPNLVHNLGSAVVAALRKKLRTVVHVYEGAGVWNPSDFTDTDGRKHFVVKLATIARLAADPTITNAMITDNRPPLLSLAAINTELVQARLADARRVDGGGPGYGALKDRLNSMDDEICDARGTRSFLTDRLDQHLDANGDILTGYVTSTMVLDGTLVDADINLTAGILQVKIAASAVVNDSFVGATTNLEDDLNEIRTVIKDLKGTTNWDDAVTDTLEGVVGEVQAARGSQSDLDSRLDVSLNEDGTLKSSGIAGALPRLAGEPSLMFYPKDGSWTNTYRLHQFRGYLKGDFATGSPPTIFVDFSRDHAQYPRDVVLGGGQGPGGRDNDALSAVVGLYWYYVYLIAKADGTVALVYSQSGRSPWTQGPLLDSSGYNFPANGWVYWKFIAAVRNGQTLSWEIVPMRKLGNFVEYEQAQRLINASGSGTGGPVQFSLGSRVPETSMRADLLLSAQSNNDGAVTLRVRPASVQSPSLETMLLQDKVPVSPFSLLGPGWKGVADSAYAGGGEGNSDNSAVWCDTDDWQRIDYEVISGGVLDRYWQLFVQGYIEFTDVASGEFSF